MLIPRHPEIFIFSLGYHYRRLLFIHSMYIRGFKFDCY